MHVRMKLIVHSKMIKSFHFFSPITEKILALDYNHILQQHWKRSALHVLHYWDDCHSDTQTSTESFTMHSIDWMRAVMAKCCYWSSDGRMSVQAVKPTPSSMQRTPLAAAFSHLVPFNHAYWRLASIFLPTCVASYQLLLLSSQWNQQQ